MRLWFGFSVVKKDYLKIEKIQYKALKLVSAILYQVFIFSSSDRPSKTMKKCFLFHPKSSFRSRDIPILVISSLPFQTIQIQKGK